MTYQPIFETTPLERVRQGMVVIGENGSRIGTVNQVRMGEPDAVTTPDDTRVDDGVGVAVAPASSPGGTTAFGAGVPLIGPGDDEPDIPDPLRTTLRRVGFIEVDGSELHGADRYIPGDRIAEVTAETVRLGSSATRISAVTTEAAASVQPSSPKSTGSVEAMLRMRVGTPSYVRGASGPRLLRDWRFAGGGALVSLATIAGAFFYFQRRKQQSRPQVRARRFLKSLVNNLPEDDRIKGAGAGGGLLMTLALAWLLNRARSATVRTPLRADGLTGALEEDHVEALRQRRRPVGFAAAVGALALCVGLLRRRTHQQSYEHIGTRGVESATGRDRTRSGELPADYGVEHIRR
jgi:hypothetical protein